MSYDDPMDCTERNPSTPAEEDTRVERAVLSFLVAKHPDHQLTIPEVSRALNTGAADFESRDAVEPAIRELVGAGLLHCEGGFVLPTRATLYFERLAA